MTKNDPSPIDIRGILNLLPHRFPFLLVDKVLSCTPNQEIRTFKNVTFNEPYFQGHFPGYPLMPGVLIVEALAQTAVLLLIKSKPAEEMKNMLFMFTSLERVKFRRQVLPGDQLVMRACNVRSKMNMWKMDGIAEVNGQLVCEARLGGVFVPQERN
jgi:3-hydroxyacyl-[acyl-carrier-protein] dehydratase